jgi:protein-S-isoprenylcysteine O-methyltransferase
MSFVSWWSITLSVVPFLVAALYRIHVEERALAEAFGVMYDDYAKSTWRLLPGVY